MNVNATFKCTLACRFYNAAWEGRGGKQQVNQEKPGVNCNNTSNSNIYTG